MALLFPHLTLEWAVAGLLLGLALIPVGRLLRSRGGWCGLLLFYSLALTATGWWQHEIQEKEQHRAARAEKVPRQESAGGYVSSDRCQSCHPNQYASWHRSYHRTMTQLPSAETVRGKFEGTRLELEGQTFNLERRGEEFWVDMVDPDWRYVQTLKKAAGRSSATSTEEAKPPRVKKPITMLTGSHHMQAYWVPSDYGNMQFSFPFTYLFEEERWVPRNDVFLFDPKKPFTHQVWNTGCINCHSTAGQPRQDPKTKIIQTRAAELGIACEACHGPAEEHVRANSDPTRRYALHRSDRHDATIFNPIRHDHVKSSETCGRCHGIRRNSKQDQWNLEGIAFRPGGDLESAAPLIRYDGADLHAPGNEKKRALMEGSFWSDGQVRVSGREFNGLATSGCFTRGSLSCVSCHSMHSYQSNDDQLGARLEGNQACIQCHDGIGAKLEQHTRHAKGSSGSLCYNCHMPHTTYGLLKAIRSHTIDSPTVQASLTTGRPNACNLCHLDQTLDWTSRKLHEWYGQPLASLSNEQKSVSAALSWLLKGDAGQRAITAWHFGWEPAQRVSGPGWMAPHLAPLLTDPYSAVRYIAQRSLKGLPGFEGFSFDYIASGAIRSQAQTNAVDLWRKQAIASTNRPASGTVLLRANGSLDDEKISTLLRQRDDRRMELLE